ncbi:MAG: ribonuclease HI [Sphingobacteriales bacterium]|nr:MAG: ribonuclease HI [Sphingobacteriales bacterium]
MSKQLVIYTDGAARGNPGPGGYGIVLQWGPAVKELSQGFRLTTNNRMELMAVIVGLQQLTRDGLDVVIYSDSAYVVNSVEKGWVFGWVKKGFAGKKNADLWMEYLKLHKKHNIKFVWVKGHANNPGNNRCDQLATAAADSRKWLVDEGYEREQKAGLL